MQWWHTSLIPHLGGRGRRFSAFEATVVYRANYKTELHRETLSEQKKEERYLVKNGPGEMAQWLRALAVLPKDLGSITSTHMAAHNCQRLSYICFMCKGVLPAHTYVHHMHAWCPQKSDKSIKSPETEVIDGCKLPCECWKPNLGPLQEQ